MSSPVPVLCATDVVRRFAGRDDRNSGLSAVSFAVTNGAMVAIAGRSGSGKTTLLNLIGGLDTPTSGHVEVFGVPVPQSLAPGAARWRASTFGYVFQVDALIATLSVAENVDVMARIAGISRRARQTSVESALELVGLGGRAHHRPHELSGGQRRRAALARAICADAPVLLADEPTAGLDSHSSAEMIVLLHRLSAERGTTIVMATHDHLVIEACDDVIRLSSPTA